jgi:hypothetical protein
MFILSLAKSRTEIMKIIKLSILLVLAAVLQLSAQTAKVTPSSFNATDKITITFDLTGTVLENVSPIYLWAWAPQNGDCPTNGQWSASNEANRMTRADSTKPIWTISFVPSKFYGFDAGKFIQIGCLAKAKDGGGSPEKKTKDFVFEVNPVKYTPSILRTFPFKFADDDVMTLVYTKTLDTAKASLTKDLTDAPYLVVEYQLKDSSATKSLFPYADDYSTHPELQLKSGAAGTYQLTTILNKLVPLKPGEQIAKVNLKIRNADGTKSYPNGPGNALTKILITR